MEIGPCTQAGTRKSAFAAAPTTFFHFRATLHDFRPLTWALGKALQEDYGLPNHTTHTPTNLSQPTPNAALIYLRLRQGGAPPYLLDGIHFEGTGELYVPFLSPAFILLH